MDKPKPIPKNSPSQCSFLDISQLYPKIASFLSQSDKLHLHSTNSVVRGLTSNSSYWNVLELCNSDNKYLYGHLEWLARYMRKCKPNKIIISLYELNSKFEQRLTNSLMEGAVESVTSLDIYCQSLDVHLATSLCFPNLEQLTVRSKCVTNELVQFMAENLPKLHSLIVIKNDLQFTCKNLSKYMPNPMEKLVIKPYVVMFEEIQLMTVRSADTLREIEIDVEECAEQNIINILKPLRKLEKLRLYHLENLQSDEQLLKVLQKQSKIQEIALTKVYNFELRCILNIISSNHLLSLDINDSKFVTDSDIITISKGCSNLRELNISWCNMITIKGLSSIIQNCLNIETLHITGIKDSKDAIFGEAYTNLLKIFNEDKFTKIKNQAMNHPELKQKQQIYNPSFFFTQPIRVDKIKTLRKLKLLDCQSCNGVSDNILKIVYIINPRARTYNYYGNYMGLFPNQSQSTFC